MSRKVAIVGSCPDTRLLAPYNDPSWEVWGFSTQYTWMPSWTHWFELHPLETRRHKNGAEGYITWLAEQTKPVYLQSLTPEVPRALEFPKTEIVNRHGDYITNSISHLLGFALLEGVKEIAVYGVNMAADDEYGYQRPSCEYWIGYARGLGAKVILPEACDLCKCRGIYGYDTRAGAFTAKIAARRGELETRIRHHKSEIERARQLKWAILGARKEVAGFMECHNGDAPKLANDRGTQLDCELEAIGAVENENALIVHRLEAALEDTNYWAQWSQ